MKNERTGEDIQLQGPVLKNLKTYMDIEYFGPFALTWEVLMPDQQGGLWDLISDARKYNDCIYLRKQGKKEFTVRFTNQCVLTPIWTRQFLHHFYGSLYLLRH